jgi:hypothetical protein
MHLVKKPKNRNRMKYDKLIIYLYDGGVFEFDLTEWTVHRSQDWVDIVKKNNTEMNSYTVGNIVRVQFVKVTEDKKMHMVKDIGVKPVPPTAA